MLEDGQDGRLKNRQKPTAHRQGKLVRLVDCIQRLAEIQYDDNFWIFKEKERFDEGHMNPKCADEVQDIMRELRAFDSTEIGDLYLTAGGRIVLDRGCGESFNDSDTVIFTRGELTNGMAANAFLKKVANLVKLHND